MADLTLEIIHIVEQSHLPVRRNLAQIGVPPTTFYRWYDRYVEHGPEELEDRPSRPSRVWNRIPDAVRDQIVDLALSAAPGVWSSHVGRPDKLPDRDETACHGAGYA